MSPPRGGRPAPPESVLRVRWTRDHWQLRRSTSQRWNTRMFTDHTHAARFALKLARSGARVEWTRWAVEPNGSSEPSEDLDALLELLDPTEPL